MYGVYTVNLGTFKVPYVVDCLLFRVCWYCICVILAVYIYTVLFKREVKDFLFMLT